MNIRDRLLQEIQLRKQLTTQLESTKGHLQFVLNNFVPYIGYGYRYWRNDLVISYVRDTTYYYMPIGLKFIRRPWYLGYEYRNFIRGVNKSFMSDVGGGRKDVTFNQDKGAGYSLEGGLIWRISRFDVKVGLSYERWEVDDSDTSFDGVDTLIEPHNSTNVLSLNVGVFF